MKTFAIALLAMLLLAVGVRPSHATPTPTPTPTATPTPVAEMHNFYGTQTMLENDKGNAGDVRHSSGSSVLPDYWGPESGTPIIAHTLSGATPVAVCNSTTVPAIDIENLVLSANVTSFTLPASTACADGEVLHIFIHQSASGGPWTLPASPIFTAGAGTAVVLGSGCGVATPVIGTTQSATVPSELHAVITYQANLAEWTVESCPTVR